MHDLFHPLPFTLPPGNVQIAFSGGRTSGYLLRCILHYNGGSIPERAIVTFQNTGREMPETLDFVRDVGERWNVPILWLEYRPRRELTVGEVTALTAACGEEYANHIVSWWKPDPRGFAIVDHATASRRGEPFVALILARKFLPNVQARFCTIEMKVRTAKRYLVSLGWKRWTNAVGLRADEPRRLNKPAKDRWTIWHPLADHGLSKTDVVAFWNRQPFDLQLPNDNGKCWLGNCDGCFLKSEADIVRLGVERPDRALWWEWMERLVTEISNAKGMEPGRGAWFSKRFTREEMRIYTGKKGKSAIAYACQKDDGECTTY